MDKANTASQSRKNFLYRVLCGVLLGVSVIAPGISGSIMAVVMGIYDELIDIISNPFKNFWKNVIYIIPICIGGLLSMIALLQILRLLFEFYPVPAYMLFISLIAGSLPTVIGEAKAGGFKLKYAVGVVCAFAVALTIGMMAKFDIALAVDTTSADSATKLIYYPACGAVAGVTSMIPGMSVSMVLMMLDVYEPLLNAAAGFDIITVAPVAACFLVGMILFSRLTKYVFRRWRGFGYMLVLGFMSGSIISIFPGLPKNAVDALLSVVAIGVGIAISITLRKLGKKFNNQAETNAVS